MAAPRKKLMKKLMKNLAKNLAKKSAYRLLKLMPPPHRGADKKLMAREKVDGKVDGTTFELRKKKGVATPDTLHRWRTPSFKQRVQFGI